jgi:hypothetical protein
MMKGNKPHLLTPGRVTMATPILDILHYDIAHLLQNVERNPDDSRLRMIKWG